MRPCARARTGGVRLRSDAIAAALRRVRIASNLNDALSGADLIQESGPELVGAKQRLLGELDPARGPGHSSRLIDLGHSG